MKRLTYLTDENNIIRLDNGYGYIRHQSNQPVIHLMKDYHSIETQGIRVNLHAKFNSSGMDGFSINAFLEKNSKKISSYVGSFDVYRISDSSWSETLIGTLPASEMSPGFFSANANSVFLGSNELSGAETYLVRCTMVRRNKSYRSSVYFNHLGCFDSINRLRVFCEDLEITKADE